MAVPVLCIAQSNPLLAVGNTPRAFAQARTQNELHHLELESGCFTVPESQAAKLTATTDSNSWWTGYQGDHRKHLITAQQTS